MKKIFTLAIILIPIIIFSQNVNYNGKGAIINTINGKTVEDINRTYWTIKNDTVVQYLKSKRKKVIETNVLGLSENEDWRIKWIFRQHNENTGEYHLIKQGIDKFTEKSYKITYYLFKDE